MRKRTHGSEERGRVDDIWAQEGYGHVVTTAGERLRFERHQVARGDFARLVAGDEVAFVRSAPDAQTLVSVRLARREHEPFQGTG